MIEVERISKKFGHITAVSDISFRAEPGEILGLLGPNGAGKTTTMRILTGFYPPSSGQARICGLDVFDQPIKSRKKIGYLPENVALYGEMRVEDYLGFVSEMKSVPKSKRVGQVGEAMEICRLGDVKHRLIQKLSKGYRQRVGLAQALVGDPEVLILDEPTIGLDPRQITEIRNLVKSFAGEKTVILSTHILPEVSMTCGRVVIVNQGRVAAEDSPENLTAALHGGGRIKMRIGGPVDEVMEKMTAIPGVHRVHHDGGSSYLVEAEAGIQPVLAATVCESGWDLHELTFQTASLEDAFLHLVTTEEGPLENV